MRAAAAPASRRSLLVAFLPALAVLTLATGASGASQAAPAAAKLPAALWGVEVDARAARALGAKRLAALRRAGINALVADPARVRGRTLVTLRRRAARARLLLVVPRKSGKTAAGVRRARLRGVNVTVVRVAGPNAVSRSVRGRRGRVLALAPLRPSPAAAAAAWRGAIRAARANASLDLAVRPVGARGAAALNAYLRLLAEKQSEQPRPPPPPPPPPPGGPPPPPPPPGSGGGGGVPVYTKENPPPTPTVDQLPKLSSVTKDGITWTFSAPAPVGQFITGDYYVVGAVTVTGISPAPGGGRNGSVRNVPATDDDTGFDSRTDGNRYRASLTVYPPLSLAPGNSLVSSISVGTVGQIRRWLFDKATGSPVRTISILTSLAAPAPPDAFRPSYAGGGGLYYSRNLRRELLPKLGAVASTPSLADWESHFRRPWVDNLLFNFDTPVEYMPDYSREIARAVGTAGLLLSLNHSTEQKEPLLVYLTQYGIDLYGLKQRGHPGWPAHGGHGSGRKFPVVFAGTLLGESAMQGVGGNFGEDMQTMHGAGWTGATALYAGHYGKSSSGQYGPYEHLQPRDWPGDLGEDYRRCCTSSAWIGEALAARLIPGMRAAWNYPAFFDYADRWMTEDDTQHLAAIEAQRGDDYSNFRQRKAWDAFVTNMWRSYRAAASFTEAFRSFSWSPVLPQPQGGS